MLHIETTSFNPRQLEGYLQPGEQLLPPAGSGVYGPDSYNFEEFPVASPFPHAGALSFKVIYPEGSTEPTQVTDGAAIRTKLIVGRGMLLTAPAPITGNLEEPVSMTFMNFEHGTDTLDVEAGTSQAFINMSLEPSIIRQRVLKSADGQYEAPSRDQRLLRKLATYGILPAEAALTR